MYACTLMHFFFLLRDKNKNCIVGETDVSEGGELDG